MDFPPLRMGLPPLHDRVAILALYAGHALRFLAGAIVLIGMAVLVSRQAGMSAAEARALLPLYVLVGLAGSALLAVGTTWAAWRRKGRRRRRY